MAGPETLGSVAAGADGTVQITVHTECGDGQIRTGTFPYRKGDQIHEAILAELGRVPRELSSDTTVERPQVLSGSLHRHAQPLRGMHREVRIAKQFPCQ